MTQKGLKMKPQDTQISINRNFLFGICDECASNSKNLVKVHIVGYGLTQNDLGTPTILPRLVRYLTVYPENSDKAWNVECSKAEWTVFHRMTLPVSVRLCPHDIHILEEYPRTDDFDPDTDWAEEIRKQTEED